MLLALMTGWVTALVGSVLIARQFGPHGKGIFALAMLARAYIALIVGFGLESAIVQRAISGPRDARSVGITGLWLAVGLGGVAGILGLLIALVPGLIDSWGVGLTSAVLFLGSGSLVVVATGPSGALRGFGRLNEVSVLLAAQNVLFVLGVGAVIAAGNRSVATVLMVAVLSSAAFLCALMLLFRRFVVGRSRVAPAFSAPIARALIRFSAKAFPGVLLENVASRVDLFIVAFFLSTASAGQYSVALAGSEILQMLPIALSVVIMQRSAEADSSGALSFQMIRLTSAILGAGAICLALIGPFAIPLAFGSDFAAAVPAFLALVPGIWCLGMWRTVTANLTGRGLPGQRSVSAVVAAAVLVVLDLALVPRWGITAAGAVSSVAYLAGLVVAVLYLRQAEARRVLSEILIPRRDDWKAAIAGVQAFASRVRRGAHEEGSHPGER
jgi:O-antigen/teichoic acid export membrane protein